MPVFALPTAEVLDLLAEAPRAVESFFPGHWQLMNRLESSAWSVVAGSDVDDLIDFLADVAVLKQPQRVEREIVETDLRGAQLELLAAREALRHIDELGYQALDHLAHVPWFGRTGGRSFSSAVLRLLRPQSFGIIDWRNLAVLMAAPGFAGLIEPPAQLAQYSPADVIAQRGFLKLTQPVYELYNNALRRWRRHSSSAWRRSTWFCGRTRSAGPRFGCGRDRLPSRPSPSAARIVAH